jgi:hypothetical protein
MALGCLRCLLKTGFADLTPCSQVNLGQLQGSSDLQPYNVTAHDSEVFWMLRLQGYKVSVVTYNLIH